MGKRRQWLPMQINAMNDYKESFPRYCSDLVITSPKLLLPEKWPVSFGAWWQTISLDRRRPWHCGANGFSKCCEGRAESVFFLLRPSQLHFNRLIRNVKATCLRQAAYVYSLYSFAPERTDSVWLWKHLKGANSMKKVQLSTMVLWWHFCDPWVKTVGLVVDHWPVVSNPRITEWSIPESLLSWLFSDVFIWFFVMTVCFLRFPSWQTSFHNRT